jgi:hypothetical protein
MQVLTFIAHPYRVKTWLGILTFCPTTSFHIWPREGPPAEYFPLRTDLNADLHLRLTADYLNGLV